VVILAKLLTVITLINRLIRVPNVNKVVETKKVATRKSGKETAKKIILTAYNLLSSGSYNDFSMRNIAKQADMRLANVQYYFSTKEDLINALIKHVEVLYHEKYEQLITDEIDDPKVGFNKLMDFCLEDVFNQETRHLFIQLWPLLSEMDHDSGELLASLYHYQIKRIATAVHSLCPEITKKESLIRGEAIASLIEGLIVVRLKSNEQFADHATIQSVMKSYALIIATTPSNNSL